MDFQIFDIIRVVDTETTGFKPPQAEMVELGWVDITLYPEGWRAAEEQNFVFVNPGHRIPSSASAIHGITDDMVAGAMPPAQARELASNGAKVLVAHNARFDKQFVRSLLPWVCTMECARKVWPRAPNHKNETLKTYLGIEVEGDAHRAGYDAAVTARIFLHLLKHMSIEQMVAISDPGHVPTRMPYGKHKGAFFKDIPTDYLRWLQGQGDHTKGMMTAIQGELQTRQNLSREQPAPAAPRPRNTDWDRGF